MSNLEKNMKAVAEALTGKKADEIPDKLEDICYFIAENYAGKAGEGEPSFLAVPAPAEAKEAPTKEEFNALITKLKETKIFI